MASTRLEQSWSSKVRGHALPLWQLLPRAHAISDTLGTTKLRVLIACTSIIILWLFFAFDGFSDDILSVPNVSMIDRMDSPVQVTDSTKLIIYLHFHKAGGTSIVSAAEQKHNLFQPSTNGNPRSPSGSEEVIIPYWKYDKNQLMDFFRDTLNRNKATFIGIENDWFHHSYLLSKEFKQQNRIELVTQLRDPLARYISDYHCIVERKSRLWTFWNLWVINYRRSRYYFEPHWVREKSLGERLRVYHTCGDGIEFPVQCRGRFNSVNDWNMYVRILSNKLDRDQMVTEEDLETAKRELDKFDLVTVLEMPETADLWKTKYGIEIPHHNENVDETYAKDKKREESDPEFEQFKREFRMLNRFDYQLYEYAMKLHKKFKDDILR